MTNETNGPIENNTPNNAPTLNNAVKELEALKNLPAEILAGNWGAIEEMETSDLIVPKIFHQQTNSKFVKDDLARAGDFCDSLTGEVLARKTDKLQVIIFGCFKTLIVSRLDSKTEKYRFEKIITILPSNAREIASKPFLEETSEGKFKNNLTYNFYCLIPERIKELPFVLSLGSTKTKAAKKINTLLYKLDQLKRPGASIIFELQSVEESNDQGSWYGLEVNQGRNSTADELLRAHAWYVKSKSQKFIVSEEEGQTAVEDSDVPF